MSRFYTFAKVYGNSIVVRGYDPAKGGHYKDKVPFNPTLFLPSKKESQHKTLDGQSVTPIKPGSIKDCREFIQQYSGVSGTTVYGMERFVYQYLSKEFPGNIDYDIGKIKLWSLDIETASENGFPQPELAEEEVLLITLKNFNTKNMITFGSRPYEPKQDNVEYVLCENEAALLNNFIAWWESVEPEVITGWNVDLFDMTYLCNRIQRLFGEKTLRRLAPLGGVSSRNIERHGRTQQKYELDGVTILDYLDIYKTFTYTNRESYRLDVIAEIELGQKKLDHSEFDTFKDFYTKGWEKFVDYNIVDVELVDRLEEKMKLIDLVLLMAYDSHCNYSDTFAQVRLWDVIIYNYLLEKDIVLAPIQRSDKDDKYAGAYVKEPKPGGYDWVVSFDLNSLYPSLIRFLNISPETLIEEKHPNSDVELMIQKKAELESEFCVAANGAQYRKDVTGFMPELIRKIYEERVQYKKNMLKCKQELVDIESEMKKRGLK